MEMHHGEVVFRKRRFRLFLNMVFLLLWLCGSVMIADILFDADFQLYSLVAWLGEVVIIVGVIYGAYFMARLLLVRGPLLRVSPKGVHYALAGEGMVPWSEVEHVSVYRSGLIGRTPTVNLVLRNTETISIDYEYCARGVDEVLAAMEPYCELVELK